MDKELTVREAMLMVLDKSPQELQKMKVLFKLASDAFDVADDARGLELVSNEIFPMVRSLTEFCTSIFDYHLAILGEDTGFEFCEKIKQLNTLLSTLAEETHNGNFTELGDILRFDMYDFVNDFEEFIPRLKECFNNSDHQSLDMI